MVPRSSWGTGSDLALSPGERLKTGPFLVPEQYRCGIISVIGPGHLGQLCQKLMNVLDVSFARPTHAHHFRCRRQYDFIRLDIIRHLLDRAGDIRVTGDSARRIMVHPAKALCAIYQRNAHAIIELGGAGCNAVGTGYAFTHIQVIEISHCRPPRSVSRQQHCRDGQWCASHRPCMAGCGTAGRWALYGVAACRLATVSSSNAGVRDKRIAVRFRAFSPRVETVIARRGAAKPPSCLTSRMTLARRRLLRRSAPRNDRLFRRFRSQ